MRYPFRCTNCYTTLNSNLKCRKCNIVYTNSDGIYNFSNQSKRVYMDTTEEALDKILLRIRKEPWKKVVYDEVYSTDPFLYQIMTSSSRADGQYLLPLRKNMRVVDIGSGYGTFAIPLAKRGIHVLAVDPSPKRLQFLSLCAKQEGITRFITPILSEAGNIPVISSYFDGAIMNGVLEWIGAFSEDEKVIDAQKKALREVYRILKKGGFYYLGIENREGLKYLLGANEDHTGIPYISLLSRKSADELSYSLLGKPYNTYTYDKRTYKKIFKNMGFKKTQVYSVLPDYKLPTIFFKENKTVEKILSYMPDFLLDTKKRDLWFLTQKLLEKQMYSDFSNSFIFINYK